MKYKEIIEFVEKKMDKNIADINDNFPHASHNNKYSLENPKWWTAGFWPGLLWQLFSQTNDEKYRIVAENCENKIADLLSDSESLDHDIGFMYVLTSVAHYKLTGDKEARKRALLAANLLMGRFNVKGSYIRAWNQWHEGEDNRGIVIIDSMMNLSLLYWATEETDDPRYKNLAKAHADMILREFVRDDGSVYHMVRFDPETGEVLEKLGGQGYAVESSWARGCAWAIYGMALSYEYTSKKEYLEAAVKISNYVIGKLSTYDKKIPMWDYELPKDTETQKYSYLDSSAGAITACGLIRLSSLMEDENKRSYYRSKAFELIDALAENCLSIDNEKEQGILLNGMGHFPERNNIDVPLIYGDYFFVEAVFSYYNNTISFW